MHNRRLTVLAVFGVGLLTILAACSLPAAPTTAARNSNSSEVGSTGAARYSQVDVAFAQMMIIHHVEATDLAGLAQQTSSTAFDKKFLSLMVAHQRGALTMATRQVSDGQNAAAVELAKSIISTQQSEIAEMQSLLHKLK